MTDVTNEPIAIVGLGLRFPESNNTEEFWRLLANGKDAISEVPAHRLHLFDHESNIKAGFLKHPIEDFDASFFGMSEKEATYMDPQYRLLHEVIWEALEHANINPQGLYGSNTCICVGVWMNTYSAILEKNDNPGFVRRFIGNGFSSAVAKLSQALRLMGPSTAIESACSSSLAAVHLACQNLLLRQADVALACGVNLLLKPFEQDLIALLLSPDHRCKSFSDDANGFVRAEGCGVLVLKRLQDAFKSGDKVLALIRGTAILQDGYTEEIGTPTVKSEQYVIQKALANAKVSANQVSYLEAHGTGTTVGDPIEIKAVAAAYCSSPRSSPLILGSVKANIGHTESCSGIAGIIKIVLAFLNDQIPAQIHIKRFIPEIKAIGNSIEIPLENRSWKRTATPRIAGVNSFGITGLNAHAVIQEPPILKNTFVATGDRLGPRPCHILKITAKSESSLLALYEKYLERIQQSQSEENLSDIAYTANICRADFSIRAVFVAPNKSAMIQMLHSCIKLKKTALIEDQLGNVCFLFTGLGCQYEGMGKLLYETSYVFRENVDACNSLLNQKYSLEVTNILFADKWTQGTLQAHICIFIMQYALFKLWESFGVRPNVVLGHSLGEVCAAVCCGILSLKDGLTLVAERSLLVDSLPGGKMLVVRRGEEVVRMLLLQSGLSGSLEIAAINSEEQIVVSGDSTAIDKFASFLKTQRISTIHINSSHAFHSKHMDPILKRYRTAAQSISFVPNVRDIVYVSGLMGTLIEDYSQVNPDYWVDHTRRRVNFLRAYQTTLDLNCKIFVEIGPQFVLSALVLQNAGEAGINEDILSLPSLRKGQCDWNCVLTALGKLYIRGVPVNWRGVEQIGNQKVDLPLYPFERKPYWPKPKDNELEESRSHPLVGTFIPTAGRFKFFGNTGFSLAQVHYLKDHRIGNSIVFPGACFLEMCLAAGCAASSRSKIDTTRIKHALAFNNFRISAPMKLIENQSVDIQTVAEPTSNPSKDGLFSIKIFQRVKHPNNCKWMLHAEADMCIPTKTLLQSFQILTRFSLSRFKDIIEKNEDSMKTSTLFYDKLRMRGVQFGKSFHSIIKWIYTADELLAKVQCLSTTHQYMIHPIYLDAMIQAVVHFQFQKIPANSILIPTRIRQFILLPRNCRQSCQHLYVRVANIVERATTSAIRENGKCCVFLLDHKENILGIMTGIEFAKTTYKILDSIVSHQLDLKPDMWEEVWLPKPLVQNNPFDLDQLRHAIPNSTEFMEMFCLKFNHYESVAHTFRTLDNLVLSYTIAALMSCEGNLGNRKSEFDEDTLLYDLRIHHKFRKQLRFLVNTLEEKKILQRINDSNWRIIEKTAKKLDFSLQNEQTFFDLEKSFSSISLVRAIGENLQKILRDEVSALDILFPKEDAPGIPSAKSFYRDYGRIVNRDEVISCILSEWLSNYKTLKSPVLKPALRCLEIGAGVGSYSLAILTTFKLYDLDFQYYFTDISSSFVQAAKATFDDFKHRMVFSTLNIEEDPIGQGYAPESFDLIIAGDVIHATRHLTESLLNVNLLLKPGGFFHMYESVRVSRIFTFVFGLLNGFWRFTDHDLRKTHCFLSTENWVNLLQKCGMPVYAKYEFGNRHNVLFCCGKINIIPICTLKDCGPKLPSKTWICFCCDKVSELSLITDRFASLNVSGRNLVQVYPDDYFRRLSTCSFGANLRSDSEVINLFENVCKSTFLEGVLYMWSLRDTLSSQEDIMQPVFYLIKSLTTWTTTTFRKWPKLIVFTRIATALQEREQIHPPNSTIVGFLRSYNNENTEHSCKLVDLGPWHTSNSAAHSVFHELWLGDSDLEIAYVEGVRYISKLRRRPEKLIELELPSNCTRFQLILPDSKSFDDLEIGPLNATSLGPNEVEIQVHYTALNFRDVLVVLAPSTEFEFEQRFGFDIAGVITSVGENSQGWKIGDSVFGINYKGTLPSHVCVSKSHLLRVPDHITLCEASTLPVAALTSVLCLLEIADISARDSVLIHTASGGVGLCAIMICRKVGATVICTAGSTRKRNYLRSLGITHVFSSRNKDYCEQILCLTEGKGVTVVLNTLTGEGYKEATLNCCSQNARFLEISMLSTWTALEVSYRRPDVRYFLVDLTKSNKHQLTKLFKKVQELVEKRIIRPLPCVQFKVTNIRQALWYLQKAKHIGKIVCISPQVCMQSNIEPRIFTPLFTNRSTYLITGGFGGIGWVVAKWMIKMGAKHIFLTGRKLPSDAMLNQIKSINDTLSVNVQTAVMDVGDMLQCKSLLQNIQKDTFLPQLRGIMHCAGILHDLTLSSHTWDTFSSTFRAKVDGTQNLVHLTQGLPLECFVVFSSGVSILGMSGQTNHAAACYFQDAVAYQRYHLGRPAVTINWGQWLEVGVATEGDIPGFKGICNNEALQILEIALSSPIPQIISIGLESVEIASKMQPNLMKKVNENKFKQPNLDVEAKPLASESESFLAEYNTLDDHQSKLNYLKERIIAVLKQVLRLRQETTLDENKDIQTFGVDSLMLLELRNDLQELLGGKVALSKNTVKENTTVTSLAKQLVNLIDVGPGNRATGKQRVPTTSELDELIAEDSKLDENIYANPEQETVNLENIQQVLVTGCTGTLGPFILHELSQRSTISVIYCLIRDKNSIEASNIDRLQSILEERNLSNVVDRRKIHIIKGDLTLPYFGMSLANWNELGDNVESVFHIAANVQHISCYTRKSSTRTVNVDGLKTILRFCVTGRKLKHVFFASTLAAVPGTDPKTNLFSETWPEDNDFSGLTNLAYPVSKFVGELLIKKAVLERGIPGKVFRFPFICGTYDTGQFMKETNHIMLRYMFILETGFLPDVHFPLAALPVDICARVSVAVFFNKRAPFDVYNLTNGIVDVDQDFIDVAHKLGYCHVEITDFAKFSDEILKLNARNSGFYPFQELYKGTPECIHSRLMPSICQWQKEGCKNPNFFRSQKLMALMPEFYQGIGNKRSMQFIEQDLLYAKSKGWLPPVGWKNI